MEYQLADVLPIFLLPFCAFVINAFFGRKLPRQGDWLSVLAIGVSSLYALRIFADFMSVYSLSNTVRMAFTWIDIGTAAFPFKIDMGIYIDNMTAIMLTMVTCVATLIHLFSTWYMKGDVRYGRFFVYLSLFTSAMIGLVLSDNLLSVFIFWEIMGFCSYSLIGFYFEKEKAGDASLKAFMTTRVGDVIFLLGILAIWSVVGNVGFVDIYQAAANGAFEGKTILGFSTAAFAAFCIFCGTIGKSAQFPLQVWLPDAMMGPTPCSALIHAATMVAAGVYLSLRVFPLIEMGDLSLFVAYIGAITAFGAATIALVQTDLKAVLAFSTISQLGYMVLGIGVGSYNAAFMHLITHAIFKACLFLSAGSVIHSVHVQEMPQMGGLRKKLPYTFLAMMCCTLAIAGIPFFSGFVSKDRILGDALYFGTHGHGSLIAMGPALLGFAGALLTAFYMFRMMFLTFFGEPRDKEIYDHCHQEKIGFNSNVPLLLLSVFTLGVFFSGSLTGQGLVKVFPKSKQEWFKVLVEPPKAEILNAIEAKETPTVVYDQQDGYFGPNPDHDGVHHAHVQGAIASIIIAFSGVFLAFLMYGRRSIDPGKIAKAFGGYTRALQNRYYFDDFYIKGILGKGLLPFNRLLSRFDMGFYDRFAIDGWESVSRYLYKTSRWIDDNVIDSAAVDGAGLTTRLFSVILRYFQSGKVQNYFIILFLVLCLFVFTI